MKEEYQGNLTKGIDQTIAGLNFFTIRDRVDIYNDIHRLIGGIYNTKVFMDRILSTKKRIQFASKHCPNFRELMRTARGLFHVSTSLVTRKETRWLYLRNAFQSLFMGFDKFE